MAEVTIPQQYASVLATPPFCAKTGVLTDSRASQTLVHTPGWIWILLLFGPLPVLIAYYATRQIIDVQIPISDELAQRRFRFRMWIVAVLVASLLLTLTGGFQGWAPAAALGIGGLFAVAASGPIIGARMWITARFDGEWIQLSRVDPGYAAAIESARLTS